MTSEDRLMKKTAALLLVLILAVSLCATASAAQYKDANWLFADWEMNGYPDDVGGVYSYDGDATHLCVLLVGRTPEREEEIRASLEDSETLRFGDATHPYADVLALRDEIETEYMGDERYGLTGIGVRANDAKTDFVVSVYTDADRFEETAELLGGKYGDMVEVVNSEAAEPAENADGGEDQTPSESQTRKATVTYMVIYVALVLLMCLLLFLRRKRRAEERK